MNQMNMHSVNMNQGVGGGVGMPPNMQLQPGVPNQMMQQSSPQQIQQQMQTAMTAQPQEKLDNISKVKSLVVPLRESLTATLKSAAQVLHQNHLVDIGSQKGVDTTLPRFDKNLEEFYSICDQIELHLKTSLACLQQVQSAQHYLPLPVNPTKMEPFPTTPMQPETVPLCYPQYLATVKSQVAYSKEIHDTLIAAAQNISPTE